MGFYILGYANDINYYNILNDKNEKVYFGLVADGIYGFINFQL